MPNAFISFNVFSMKKPLDDLTKAKLIYSGELILFAIVAAVLATLTLTGVIGMSDTKVTWFTWITLVGGTLLIGNTIWFFASKKKRAKGSWLDTLLLLPVPFAMIPIDIIHLVNQAIPNEDYKFIISSALFYVTAIYTIEGIYHWFNPLPVLVEAAKEDEEEKKKEEKKPTDIDSEI